MCAISGMGNLGGLYGRSRREQKAELQVGQGIERTANKAKEEYQSGTRGEYRIYLRTCLVKRLIPASLGYICLLVHAHLDMPHSNHFFFSVPHDNKMQSLEMFNRLSIGLLESKLLIACFYWNCLRLWNSLP